MLSQKLIYKLNVFFLLVEYNIMSKFVTSDYLIIIFF